MINVINHFSITWFIPLSMDLCICLFIRCHKEKKVQVASLRELNSFSHSRNENGLKIPYDEVVYKVFNKNIQKL